MKKILSLFFAALLLLSALVACTETEQGPSSTPSRNLVLAEGGKSDYRVVIGKDASEDTQKMSVEFTDYFKKICGVTLAVVTDETEPQEKEIVIGRTTRKIDQKANYETLGEEEYFYAADDASLLLTGKTDRAMAYAVYAFLEERLGVRYLTYDTEYVPELDVVKTIKNYSYSSSPAFSFRTLEGTGAADPKWGVKMRFNSLQSLGSVNYRRDFFVGGGIGYADWYVHTITKLAEMPDKNENGDYNTAQPCLTDENVYQTVLKNVRAWLEKWPDAKIVSISQNDGGDESEMCACENCTKIYEAHGNVQSAKWVAFVSRIANELKDEYPDVYFDTLAYSFTMSAPTDMTVPDNVIIRLAPIGSCYEHANFLCADDRGNYRAQRINAKLKHAVKDWSAIAQNIYVWDYSALFANYLAPLTNYDFLRENMAMFYQNGVVGYYMQGSEHAPFAELVTYLTAKLLWNPEMSEKEFETHAKEFCTLYYGSYEPLADFIDLVDTEAAKSHYSTHGVVVRDFLKPTFFNDSDGVHLDTTLIDEMNDCFDRAEKEAKTDEQKTHLKKARTQVKYYELLCMFELEKQEGAVVDLSARRALAQSLYDDLVSLNTKWLSERIRFDANKQPNTDVEPLKWFDETAENDDQY